MTIIIAHIKGPSGAGKTTIGEIINEKYKFIKNIDTDDVLIKDLPSIFPNKYLKYLKNDNLDLFRKKYFSKALYKVIKPYKYVILVGDARLHIDNIYYNIEDIVDIDTKSKYIIDIDEDTLIKSRFNRHFQFIANNIDRYFKKAQKKPLCVDLNTWTGERLYWGNSRSVYYDKSQQIGYIKEQREVIIKNLDIMIKNLDEIIT